MHTRAVLLRAGARKVAEQLRDRDWARLSVQDTRKRGWENTMAYDAFISYSHATDGCLAPAVQSGLQRLARHGFAAESIESAFGPAIAPDDA